MNYLLENINTSIARAAELTTDPAMLRVLKTIKQQVGELARAADDASQARPSAAASRVASEPVGSQATTRK
ncbi:hypothetical protein CAL18_03755 [Bordetella genomosp. 7]|uniref:Uncharacterized protein n=1 Tax=Bordetella genomosp. 7 TaxID=1416805 RepID=A0A261RI25_9BORD|nr:MULTISPECIES: hypothetical protein [Bordetella]OZI24694.1 hypothetical protein CAL19_04130 [Bordetella genomosp. 7]OZI27729.1 hypothetical protein CAL18_03755 [Bordetella genomosp. 7]